MISDIQSIIPISKGGTGGTSAIEARTNLELMKGYELYSNSNGNQGTITLSDSVNNYSYIEIFYRQDSLQYKSVKIDNKDYYLIKNFINSDYMYDADAKEVMAYVEKDTGLPFKIVEIFEENGTTLEKVSLFEYKFDCVTDSDMVEPDETMFSIQEE